jgi:hypothetical protein
LASGKYDSDAPMYQRYKKMSEMAKIAIAELDKRADGQGGLDFSSRA